ncbi:MAG: hypothetical protein HN423_02390 [Alphaproteobacteria bacterium]|nr:hypothetical protein [Alphaproteobacteria bacterium]
MVQKIIEQVFPGYGVIGLALVVLNPNLLVHANLAKGEVALMLLVFLAFVCLIQYAKSPRLWLVAGCGAALGLSALVRPVAQYLIYSLPLVFLLIAMVSGRGFAWLASFSHGALATVVAIAVVSPWVMYVSNAGHGYRMVDKAEEHLFFLDNLRFLSLETPGRRAQAPKTEYLAGEDGALAATIPNWESLTDSEKYVFRLKHIKEHYLSGAIPPAVFAQSFVWSWVRTLAGAGAGWAQVLYTGVSAEGQPQTTNAFTVLSGIYVVIARILGLIGLWAMIRHRQFGLLVACVGLVAYVTLLPLFHGQSRYRVTIEPQLAVMAAFGVIYLHMMWLRLKNQPNPDATQDA